MSRRVTLTGWGGKEHAEPQRMPIIEALARGTRKIEKLTDIVTVGRGTQDIRKLEKPSDEAEVRAKIEEVLRTEMKSTRELIIAIAEPAGRVVKALRILHTLHKLYNAGDVDQPMWSLRIGDETSASELRDLIRRLIAKSPMSVEEISFATGAREKRVICAITEIRKTDDNVVKVGLRWFAEPPGVH